MIYAIGLALLDPSARVDLRDSACFDDFERALTLLEQHTQANVGTRDTRPGKKDSGNSSTLVPHGQKYAAKGEERLDAETLDLIDDGLVSLTFTSWNQTEAWLRQLDALRGVAEVQLQVTPGRSLELKDVLTREESTR